MTKKRAPIGLYSKEQKTTIRFEPWFLFVCYLLDKLEFDILTIILVYSAKTDNQFSVMSLSNKTFKSFFELVRAFSRRINVSNTNAFVWLG